MSRCFMSHSRKTASFQAQVERQASEKRRIGRAAAATYYPGEDDCHHAWNDNCRDHSRHSSGQQDHRGYQHGEYSDGAIEAERRERFCHRRPSSWRMVLPGWPHRDPQPRQHAHPHHVHWSRWHRCQVGTELFSAPMRPSSTAPWFATRAATLPWLITPSSESWCQSGAFAKLATSENSHYGFRGATDEMIRSLPEARR